MGEVKWTAEAERWVREIHAYIARDNPAAARRVAEGLHQRAEVLKDFPLMGHLHHGSPEEAVRILLYGHYRIAYIVKPNGDVDVLGVFHGALDIERFLG